MISGIGVLATGQAISILVGAMDGYRDAAAWAGDVRLIDNLIVKTS